MTADEIACTEVEAAFLGSVLRMGSTVAGLVLLPVVVDDFVDPRHRLVLTGIRGCVARGVSPGTTAVLGELRRLGLEPSFLDDKSSVLLLAELYAAALVPASATHYLRIVGEHSFRRRVIEAGERIGQVAGTSSLEAVRDVLDDEWRALHSHFGRIDRHDEVVA